MWGNFAISFEWATPSPSDFYTRSLSRLNVKVSNTWRSARHTSRPRKSTCRAQWLVRFLNILKLFLEWTAPPEKGNFCEKNHFLIFLSRYIVLEHDRSANTKQLLICLLRFTPVEKLSDFLEFCYLQCWHIFWTVYIRISPNFRKTSGEDLFQLHTFRASFC